MSSDDTKQYKEWYKRMKENQKHSVSKFMHLFSVEELERIAPEGVDYQFRFDIVGGNARAAFAGGGSVHDEPLIAFIKEAFRSSFMGEKKSESDKDWAVLVVPSALARTTNKKDPSDSVSGFVVSIFFKYIKVNDLFHKAGSQWSSAF